MKQCKIDKLCAAINQARGLSYPSIGYLFYADIRGDGIKRPRSVWQITNGGGGVSRAYDYLGTIPAKIKALEKTLNELRG